MTVKQVIRNHGRPMEALDWNGEKIYRLERIFVKSHNRWYEPMDYDNHFVYKTTGYGSSLMCTCGSIAGAFQYEAYKRFFSTNKGQMLCCVNYINTGKHSDGST